MIGRILEKMLCCPVNVMATTVLLGWCVGAMVAIYCKVKTVEKNRATVILVTIWLIVFVIVVRELGHQQMPRPY